MKFNSVFNYIKSYWAIAVVLVIAIVGTVIRFKVYHAFTSPITEDSDGYLMAAEFLTGDYLNGRQYLAQRLSGYPLLIGAFSLLTELPVKWLMYLQLAVSIVPMMLIYFICRNLKINKLFSLVPVGLLAFHGIHVRYSGALAPEFFVNFFLVLSFYLFTEVISQKKSNPKNKYFFALGLGASLAILCLFKDMFVPYVLLLTLSTIGYGIVSKWRASELVKLVSSGTVAFIVLFFGVVSFWSSKIGHEKFYPSCHPWAPALTRYYVNFEKSTHLPFKQRIKDSVPINKKKLEDWDYTFLQGSHKVNSCTGTLKVWCESAGWYVNEYSGIKDDLSKMCLMKKVHQDLFFEALPRQWTHYVKHYAWPEVYRFFFLDHELRFGGWRAMTVRSSQQFGHIFGGEFKNSFYDNARSEEFSPHIMAQIDKFKSWTYSRHNHISWVLLFLLVVAVPYLYKTGITKRENFLATVLTCYLIGYVIMVAFLVWFLERYFMYLNFAMFILVAFVGQKVLNLLIYTGNLTFRRIKDS